MKTQVMNGSKYSKVVVKTLVIWLARVLQVTEENIAKVRELVFENRHYSLKELKQEL